MSRRPTPAFVIAVLLCAAIAAAQVATDRAVGWERARAEIAKYRATLDNSGLVEVDARISTRVDAEDLQALCRARTDAVTAARQHGESVLAALPPGDDPITNEKRANAYRHLGAVASAQGDMVTARRHFGRPRRPRAMRPATRIWRSGGACSTKRSASPPCARARSTTAW